MDRQKLLALAKNHNLPDWATHVAVVNIDNNRPPQVCSARLEVLHGQNIYYTGPDSKTWFETKHWEFFSREQLGDLDCEESRSIKIVSNGQIDGTKVFNSDGAEINGVGEIEILPITPDIPYVRARITFVLPHLKIDVPDKNYSTSMKLYKFEIDHMYELLGIVSILINLFSLGSNTR